MQEKTEHQQRVEELMVKASQVIPDRPTMPDEKTRLLRAKLILEESLETVKELGFAIIVDGNDVVEITEKVVLKECVRLEPNGHENLEGIADGCADISVVTIGTLSACGISDVLVLQEVDRNNLAKFEHRCPKCGHRYKE